jgi:hypothetical protein
MSRSKLLWRYMDSGKRKHLLMPGFNVSRKREDWSPACGFFVFSVDMWKGVGSAAEQEKLASLEKCQNCERRQRELERELAAAEL